MELFPLPEMTAVYPLEADEERALETLTKPKNIKSGFGPLALRLLELSSQIEDWVRLADASVEDPKRIEAELGVGVDRLVELAEWRALVADDIDVVRRVRNELAHGKGEVSRDELADAVRRAEDLVADAS